MTQLKKWSFLEKEKTIFSLTEKLLPNQIISVKEINNQTSIFAIFITQLLKNYSFWIVLILVVIFYKV